MNALCIEQLLDIGIALSRQKDRDSLLERILLAAMNITACDGGTLYIKNEDKLSFKLMITKSTNTYRGGKSGAIELPPVPLSRENVCARAAIDKQLINIPDVYESMHLDLAGPRSYDALTGYHTASMLVIPMEDDTGEVIGVLQLLNAQDLLGHVIPFSPCYEPVVLSLASQAAICLTNMNYATEIRELLESFARVISAAIEARMPYNASHTHNMVRIGSNFLNWLDDAAHEWKMTAEEKHQFILCIWLHDIGKLAIPLEIMDKNSRLGPKLEVVMERFRVIGLLNQIALLEGRIDEAEFDLREKSRERACELVNKANSIDQLTDALRQKVDLLARRTYIDECGEERLWLSQEEQEALTVSRGTLTNDERMVMQSHVVMTEKMLSEMKFSGIYAHVSEWAVQHHELLDGSGYPRGLSGDEISREVRLLTLLDIFDALTAHDRPYKAPMPVERALLVLHDMVNAGQLDADILALFEESKAWEDVK